MTRYYCSGYDENNAFGHGIGDMLKNEIKHTNSVVYIPGGLHKVQIIKEKFVPDFIEQFKKIGIEFDKNIIITYDLTPEEAQKAVREAGFVFLMGGDPFMQKEICEKLGLIEELKNYDGVMMGFSAGAMLMSKYIIITPCSDIYPDFHIEEGLDLDGISIYPHNNTSEEEYPNTLFVRGETYQKDDLIKVAKEYGNYYLLQDNVREDGLVDVSIIKSTDGNLELYTENNGKMWIATPDGVKITKTINQDKKLKK